MTCPHCPTLKVHEQTNATGQCHRCDGTGLIDAPRGWVVACPDSIDCIDCPDCTGTGRA